MFPGIDPLALARRARARAGSVLLDNAFRLLAAAGRLHPSSRPETWGVEMVRDVPYRPTGMAEHRLDVYRPVGPGPWPAVLYIHGGGFRILSKDSHYVMALAFARRGYVVFNMSYRLAPRHPFPAAVEDVAAAWAWLGDHARRHNADLGRVVVAGESAGANLATTLAVCSSYPRPEPFARTIFQAGHRPAAVVAACGVLQVSDPHRFARRRPVPRFVSDRVESVTHDYLSAADGSRPGGLELADPLLLLERGPAPERPLPPFFAFAGTRDVLLDDTRRLGAALERLEVPHQVRFYPGGVHAFHAFAWQPIARHSWQETFDFLDGHLTGQTSATKPTGAPTP